MRRKTRGRGGGARWRRSLSLSGGLVLAWVSLACTWNDGTESPCTGAPVPGDVSSWADCEPSGRLGDPLAFFLSNDAGEPAWLFHHCDEQVPWLSRLDDAGQWQPLLPRDYSLAVGCAHVEVLEPGDSLAFTSSTLEAQVPGVYRLETLVAFGCADLHDPHHVVSACASTRIVAGVPFELLP